MTRKHFEALAAALKDRKPMGTIPYTTDQWELDCEGMASVCARFNPNFDRARFLKACGVEEAK